MSRVGSLLSSRLCAEGGVMAVVRGVLDLGGGVGDMDWKQVAGPHFLFLFLNKSLR